MSGNATGRHGFKRLLAESWITVAVVGGITIVGTGLAITDKMTQTHAIWVTLVVLVALVPFVLYTVSLSARLLNRAEEFEPNDMKRLLSLTERAVGKLDAPESVIVELYVSQRSVHLDENEDGDYVSSKDIAVMVYSKFPKDHHLSPPKGTLVFEHPPEFRFTPEYAVGITPGEKYSNRRTAEVPLFPGITHILLKSPEVPKARVETFDGSTKTMTISLHCATPNCHMKETVRIEGIGRD